MVANIVELAKRQKNDFIEISYNSIPDGLRVGPYEREADERFDEYFVEKLIEIQGNPKYVSIFFLISFLINYFIFTL